MSIRLAHLALHISVVEGSRIKAEVIAETMSRMMVRGCSPCSFFSKLRDFQAAEFLFHFFLQLNLISCEFVQKAKFHRRRCFYWLYDEAESDASYIMVSPY